MALDLSFKDLADTATQTPGMNGRPLLIPLAQIDEDPDQPRRVFSHAELTQLAESIRAVGVLQPIIVRRDHASGRYIINMGARRHRAARLAGLDAIPVIVQDAAEPDRYAQMVENIQRDDLAATEIATFVAARLGAGDKQAEIARKLGKPKDWVSRYAAIPRMPDFLRAKLHSSPIRAVYELYQAWRERPELVERACASQDSFTDAQARRVARQLGASSSTPADRAGGDDIRAVPRKPEEPAPIQNERSHPSEPPESPREHRRPKPAVTILVSHGDRSGRLLIDDPAHNGSRFAVVLILETGQTEELSVSELQIEEIVQG
jgi:ParB family chromosome partitioning protein